MSPFLLAAVLAAVVALTAWRLGALTPGGAGAAWLVGTVVFGVGGWTRAAPLLMFFGTSSALSVWRRRTKEKIGYAKTGRRDAGQVWANGGVATACALWAAWQPSPTPFVCFLAALAAANADTWATEIGGALGGRPRMLTTGKPAPAGTSGAVSAAGTLAAFAGAATVGAFAWPQGERAVLVVTLAGLMGSLADSLLGATVQAQWRDPENPPCLTERSQPGQPPARGWRQVSNDVVNGLCTLVGAAVTAWLAG